MKLLIVNDSAENCPEEYLNKWIVKLSDELEKRSLVQSEKNNRELSIVFLDEKDAKRINWQYRSKDYATDVLSFETDDPDGFGELVMCPQVLKRQALENKLTYENELCRMIVHGVLHLLGHNHETSTEEEKRVLKLQEDILIALHPPEKKLKLIKGGKKSGTKTLSATKAKSTASAKQIVKASAAAKSGKAKKVLTQDKKHGKKK